MVNNELSEYRSFQWQPREGLLYKSWSKGDSHFGKSSTVTILQNGIESIGTFKVENGKCEIRIGRKPCRIVINTPSNNVVFSKKIKQIDTIWAGKQGQNGYYGKEIRYTAKIIDSTKTETRMGENIGIQ